MNNLLIGIGVLIVAVLSALFAVPHFVDWNSYRGVIEEEASRMAGRDVRIGGTIDLQLLPVPSFTIQKLRIADTATGSGEPLFRAERVEAKLSIAPLLRGVLEAHQIELVQPVVHIVLDDAGRGNWRDLAQGRGSLPFMPKDVALQAVKITDGMISLLDRNGLRERLTIEHLAGLLSAPALKGPYRFAGRFGVEDQLRDLRFTTLPPDASGAVPFKVLLKDLASLASATLDGRFGDVDGQPAIAAALSATLPRPGLAKAAKAGDRATAPLADLKADIAGDSTRLELKNLSVAFDSAGRPEVLSGGAMFSWDGELTTVAKLTTPWIDLDNVLDNAEGGNPLLALAAFAQRINGLVPGTGTTSTLLEIDQANLGHDQVADIRVDARSSAGLLALQELRATLPGGSRVEMQGSLTGQGTSTTFDGDMTLRGTSLARFAGWATAGGVVIEPINDQPYQMRGRVTLEPSRSGLRDIVASFGDSTLDGTIDYSWLDRRLLKIALEGARIDARAVAPQKLSLGALAKLAAAHAGGAAASSTGAPWSAIEVQIGLEAAELVLPEQTLRDVSAQVESSARGLQVERLQFSGTHGVAVSVSGLLRAAGSSEVPAAAMPLHGSVAAADAEGLRQLINLIDWPASLLPDPLRDTLLPLRLAGTVVRTPGQAGGPVVVAAEGRLGTMDAKIKAELTGGLDGWRAAPADLDLVLLAPSEARLSALALQMLRGEASTAKPAAATPAEMLAADHLADGTAAPATRLAIRATGVAAHGLSTAVRFDSPDVTAFLHGTTTVDAASAVRVTGDVTLDARDGRDLLLDAGGLRLALADPLVLRGQARLDAQNGRVALTSLVLSGNAGADITGRLLLVADVAPRPRHLTGELTVSTLDAGTLLATVVPRGSTEQAVAAAAAAAQPSHWPHAKFDFSRLAGLDLAVKLKTGLLTLSDGVTVADAEFMLLGRRDALEVRDLRGSGLGGRIAASALLEPTPAGAALTVKVALTGARLGVFGSTGTADALWQLGGSGQSPAGLVAALAGSGAINLAAAEVRQLTPETLQAAIDGALKVTPDKLSTELRAALAAEAARPAVAIGPRSVKLVVQDGVAKAEPVVLTTREGRMTGGAALDFSTFAMNSSWRVETRLLPPPALPPRPASADPARPEAGVVVPTEPLPLPAVVERFAAAPATLSTPKAARVPADTDALERELAVRKVERDLAELERLRRLDEARAAEAKAAAEQAEWNRQTEIRPNAKPDAAAAPTEAGRSP